MDRLTFEGDFCEIAKCLESKGGPFCKDAPCSQRQVWERLKAYEDAEERAEADKALFRRALDTFGAEAQTRMVFEEFSELQKEFCKHSRGKDNTAEIAEEIADVQIMLEQMIILHGCAYEVKRFREAKLIYLEEKILEAAHERSSENGSVSV